MFDLGLFDRKDLIYEGIATVDVYPYPSQPTCSRTEKT